MIDLLLFGLIFMLMWLVIYLAREISDARILIDLMSDELIRQDEAYDDLRKEFYEALPKEQLTKEKK